MTDILDMIGIQGYEGRWLVFSLSARDKGDRVVKALITGGAGFIGSHLADRLLADGCEVTVLDDLSTGSLDNIAKMGGDRRFRFVEGSVLDPEVMDSLIEKADVVFHLAAAVGVQLSVDQPVRTIETNVHGTELVLRIANRFGKRVLLASSSDVYGKSAALPLREDDDTVLGSTKYSRWAYACSKAIDEYLGLAYYQEHGLGVVVTRFFNTVGPRQTGRYGMVLPRFVEWALKDEPLLIHGDGQQTRCFGYVGDVVEGAVALMNSPEARGQVYNIGSEEEVTIDRLADMVIETTASKSEKKFISYEQAFGKPSDDMRRRVPSLARIRQTVGFEPKMSLGEILPIVIQDVGERMRSKLS